MKKLFSRFISFIRYFFYMLNLKLKINKFLKLSTNQINESVLRSPYLDPTLKQKLKNFNNRKKSIESIDHPFSIILPRQCLDQEKANEKNNQIPRLSSNNCIFDFAFQANVKKNAGISSYKVIKKDEGWDGILFVLPKDSLIKKRHSQKRPPGYLEDKTEIQDQLGHTLKLSFQDQFNLYYIKQGIYFGTLGDLMARNKSFTEEEIKFVAICCFFGRLKTNFVNILY